MHQSTLFRFTIMGGNSCVAYSMDSFAILDMEEKQIATLRDNIYIVWVNIRCSLQKSEGRLGVKSPEGKNPNNTFETDFSAWIVNTRGNSNCLRTSKANNRLGLTIKHTQLANTNTTCRLVQEYYI